MVGSSHDSVISFGKLDWLVLIYENVGQSTLYMYLEIIFKNSDQLYR